jgi:hypothetical protein
VRKFILVMLPVALIASLAVACGGGSKKTVDIPGVGQVSSSNKLPSDFPGDFPTYKGADVQASTTGKYNGISGLYVIWQTGDSVDKVKSYFDDQFKNGSWKSNTTATTNGTSYWIVDSPDHKKAGYVSVSEADGKTSISAAIGDNTDASASATEGASSSSSGDTPEPSDTSSSSSQDTPTTSSADLPAEASLSSDFPKDRVPFPDNSRVTSSTSVSSSGQKNYYVEVYVKESVSNVNDYFKNELPKHGWTDAFASESNGSFVQTYSGATPADPSGQGESLTVSVDASDVSGYAKVTIIASVAGS